MRCEATQFAVAATNHSALSSHELKSAEIKSHVVRWGEKMYAPSRVNCGRLSWDNHVDWKPYQQ